MRRRSRRSESASRRPTARSALLPLGFGHALAVAVAIIVAVMLGVAVPPPVLRWAVAMALVALGLRLLFRHPHLRWAAMLVSMADLTLWAILVGSVLRAGLMW